MALRDSALNIVIKAKDLTGRTLRRFNRALDDTDKSAKKAGDQIKHMAKAVGALIAATVGISAITAAFKSMLKTGDDFEKLDVTMSALMGSVAEGENATAWIKQFAQDTPHQVTEVTEAFIALKGFGLDPMDGSLQAIVDQSAKLGKGFEGVKGVSLALGQAWAKQKLQGEEILQLVERGVPVWDLLAKVTGRNTKELQELSSAGALGRDVIADLIEEMGKTSTGAAAANMSLLSGYISNLKDAWANFLNEIAQSGALDYAKDSLRELLDTVQAMQADGSLARMAKSWSDGFITVASTIKRTVVTVASFATELRVLGQAWLAMKVASWAGALRTAATGFVGVAAGAGKATAAIKLMSSAMRVTIFAAVAEVALRVAYGINEVRLAAEANTKAGARLAASYAKANAQAIERARVLGLEISHLSQWKIAIRDGVVVLNETTGAYELNRQAAEAQGYQLTATAAAMTTLKQNALALQAPFAALKAAFADARAEGDTLNEALEKVGAQAAAGGVEGVKALALHLRELEYQGVATREELINGLGGALAELNDEARAQFATDLTAALEDVSAAGDDTVVKLGQIQTLLEANLVAAAKAAGISLTETLTGIDDKTTVATTRLRELVDAMEAAGKGGEDAAKIMAAGFDTVIATLDSPEELQAFTDELRQMAIDGEISTATLNEGLNAVLDKTRELEAQAQQTGDALSGAMNEAGAAAEGAAQVGNTAAGIGAAMAGIYEGVHAEIEKLSSGAVEAFESLQAMGNFETDKPVGEMESFTQSIEESAAAIGRMADVAVGDVVGVSTWMKNLRINAEQTKIAFYEQSSAFTQLMNNWESGRITAEQFTQQASAARDSMGLLNDQDLGALDSAIRQAEQSMARLKQGTQDTLATLQNELDSLQGNTQDIEKRQYEERKRDLEAALANAQSTADTEAIANAGEALRVAEDIHRAKLAQIQEKSEAEARAAADAERREIEQAQREQERARARQPERQTRPSEAPAPAATPGTTIELKLGGKTTTVTTDNPDGLLDLLADAGMRTQ